MRQHIVDFLQLVTGMGAGLLIGLSAWAGVAACGGGLSATQEDSLQETASQIAHCQTVGRKQNSYSAYECCMIAAGLTSGPSCVVDHSDAGGDR